MKKNEEPKLDLSQLSPEDQEEMRLNLPWGWIIFFAVLVALMIFCFVMIMIL